MAYYANPAVQAEIRRRANQGRIIITNHARDQAIKRNVDDSEIYQCLKQGAVVSEDWNAEFQETTFNVTKPHGLSKSLTVVVALQDDHDIAVTVFWKKNT